VVLQMETLHSNLVCQLGRYDFNIVTITLQVNIIIFIVLAPAQELIHQLSQPVSFL